MELLILTGLSTRDSELSRVLLSKVLVRFSGSGSGGGACRPCIKNCTVVYSVKCSRNVEILGMCETICSLETIRGLFCK